MGCGSSKSPLTDEPDITSIKVPDSEPGYPKPKPPILKKEDIFHEENFQLIDEKTSKIKVSDDITYEELLATITQDLNTDLEKLRAIFYFMGSQNIEKQFYPGVTDPHTPRGYMKLIKLNKGYYASFFALLCRAARLPCVILWGKGKSVGYEVGDEDVSELHSSWNAVYIDEQWRVVHPHWAFTWISGYNSGRWVKIEDQGERKREKTKTSKGTHVSGIKEYWFMPDPDQFVHFCIADQPEWQLLVEPWTTEKFVNVPYFWTAYFEKSDMTLASTHKAVLVSHDGKVEIKFDHADDCKSEITYQLFFDENLSRGKLPAKDDLPRCVFFESREKEKRLMYRFHVEGVYKTVVYCGGSSLAPIVSFKIDCNEVSSNANLFPINPQIGFGYNYIAKEKGLLAPTVVAGVVQTDKNKPSKFEFRLNQDKEMEASLRHNDFRSEELQQYIQQETKDDQVKFNVSVPEHKDNGEFALQIYTVEGNMKSNVVNYLLTDNREDFRTGEGKEMIWLKEQLKNAIKQNDAHHLEKAITEFEQAKILDEERDLPKAQSRLRELRIVVQLKVQLKKSITGDNPDLLKKAISEFEQAHIPDEDGDLSIAKAKLQEIHTQKQLKGNLKKAMKSDNLAELRATIAECEAAGISDDDKDLANAKQRLQELLENKLNEEEMQRLSNNLRKAIDRGNLVELEAALSQCEQNGLHRDDDVHRGRQLLVDLYEQALEHVMKSRDVEEVQRLVDSAKVSPVNGELSQSEVMEKAERFLRQQARLQKYLSVVLELKPSTVSEIHRYSIPNDASIHAVVATYLILGEDMADLKKWKDIRNLLRMTGPRGIIRRIRMFTLDDLDEDKAQLAKQRLDKYTLDEVRLVSAGAAAFHVWSSNIVTEVLSPEVREKDDGKQLRA